jgi:hypothetical protein
MKRLRRLISLSAGRRRALAEAWGRLLLVNLGLRTLGFRRILAALSRAVLPVPPQGADSLGEWVAVAAWAVRAAASHGPIRANCLPQSLTLWWMLQRRGLDARIRFGARKTATGIEAHAWVELQGDVLNDRPDVASAFRPFPGDSSHVGGWA